MNEILPIQYIPGLTILNIIIFIVNLAIMVKHAVPRNNHFCQFNQKVKVHVIWESPPQFENRITAWVYVRSISRNSMYQKAPFCSPEMAQ